MPGARRKDVQPDVVDLTPLVRQTAEEQRATSSKHQIRVDVPDQLLGWWDRERIAQVLANLISHALKYSPRGGLVTVAVSRTRGSAVVCVADQGMGIAPDQIAKLFRPFSRVGQPDKIDGTGLGPYVTKRIVEAHGGRIWVESALGRGSTLFVALPIGKSLPMETPRSSGPAKEIRVTDRARLFETFTRMIVALERADGSFLTLSQLEDEQVVRILLPGRAGGVARRARALETNSRSAIEIGYECLSTDHP